MAFTQISMFVLLIATSVVTGGKDHLEWKNHYGKARQLAQTAKRPLVVVIESPVENKQIDERSLDGISKNILLREDFELVRVNANTDYGKRVALAFGAKRLPYTAVTNNTSSQIVFRKAGQMSHGDWTLALAKSVSTKSLVESSVRTNSPRAATSVKPETKAASFPLSTPAPASETAVAPRIMKSPVITSQPVISTQILGPHEVFVFPSSQQCFT